MIAQQNQSVQASTPKTWDRATAKVNIGDYIRAPFMPIMQVVNKDTHSNGKTYLLVKPNSDAYREQWVVEPEQEAQTEFEQGREHGRNDAAERLHPIYTKATCQYSAGYLEGYNTTPTPQQTKTPAAPHWTVIYDGDFWYKAYADGSFVGKATTYQKAEQMAQKAIASKKFWQEHRERVLASYAG